MHNTNFIILIVLSIQVSFFFVVPNERDWKQQRVLKIHNTQKSVPYNCNRKKIVRNNHTITFSLLFRTIFTNALLIQRNSMENKTIKTVATYSDRTKNCEFTSSGKFEVAFIFFFFGTPLHPSFYVCVQLNEGLMWKNREEKYTISVLVNSREKHNPI